MVFRIGKQEVFGKSLLSKRSIIYCGIVDHSFSLGHVGGMGATINSSVNVFYPITSKEITLMDKSYRVIKVTPTEIELVEKE